MLNIESKTFGVIKENLVEENETWTTDLTLNKKADLAVATAIFKSFKNYEKSKKQYEQSYFSF